MTTTISRKKTIGTLVAATAITLTSFVVPGAANAAPPAPISMNLGGVQNARDIGGYTTTSGKVVKTGVVYRTAQLSGLTDAGRQTLKADNVTIVDDLRTGLEQTLAPDNLGAGTTIVHNTRDYIGFNIAAVISTPKAYLAFVDDSQTRAALAQVLKDIEGNSGATLYHCTVGKDRTGWTTAVLLTILGVDRATVNADYLASNTFNHTPAASLLGGVTLDLLNSSFNEITAKYGTFDKYVSDGLGLTATDVSNLKAKLLA